MAEVDCGVAGGGQAGQQGKRVPDGQGGRAERSRAGPRAGLGKQHALRAWLGGSADTAFAGAAMSVKIHREQPESARGARRVVIASGRRLRGCDKEN